MINKNRFGVANDKKLLRKIGKQWVTVSALTLVLLGGGAIASSVVTHAATNSPAIETQNTNSVKKQINGNLDKAYQSNQSTIGSNVSSSEASSASASSANKPSNVESKATNMHDALMMNAAKSSNNSSSSSVSSASVKSSVASSGSVSSSAKPSFNSAYQSYMAQMSGTDSEVTKDNDKNTQNNNSNNNQNQPVIKHNLGDTNFFTGATHTGTDDGLNYTAYANGGVEFTGGMASKSDLSDFTNLYENDSSYDIHNSKAIKFDSNIDMSNVSDMQYMFSQLPNTQYIDLGNNFDTSKVTNMQYMFDSDTSLKSLNLGSNFTTSNISNKFNEFSMFSKTPLNHITINNFDTKFNSDSVIPEAWRNSNGIVAVLSDGNSHVGNWTKITPGTATINFNGDPSANTTITGQLDTSDNISAPSGYHFTDGKSTEKVNFNDGSDTFNVLSNSMAMDTITFHDIYGNVDMIGTPVGKTLTGNVNDSYTISAPKGWAIVNPDGTIANGTNNIFNGNSKTFKYSQGNQTIDLAPEYDGLIYKYNSNTSTLEFTGGTAQSDLSNFNKGLSDISIPNFDLNNVPHIKFDDNVDMSHVTNMSNMFTGNESMNTVDLGNNFDTSHVTNMSGMFASDDIDSLNLGSKFNTSHVTDMSNMFNRIELQSLNLNNEFDTSNVTNMNNMFSHDDSLTSLNLGNKFNTSKVTNMDSMFYFDYSLKSLVLPKSFDTSNVTDMNNMLNMGWFTPQLALTIQSPKTKIASDAGQFYSTFVYHGKVLKDKNGKPYTYKDPTEDLSKGKVGTYTNYSNPLEHYDDLYYVYIPSDNSTVFLAGTANPNNHRFAISQAEHSDGNDFYEDDSDSNIVGANTIRFGSDADVSKLTNMSDMFSRAINYNVGISNSQLHVIDLGNNFDTSNTTNMHRMFASDSALNTIIFSPNFDTSKVSNMSDMFSIIGGRKTDGKDIYTVNPSIQKLIIKSPKTKFKDGYYDNGNYINDVTKLGVFYKQLLGKSPDGRPYTLPFANDFTKGNVGTFIKDRNVPTDTIDYMYNGKQLATQSFDGSNYLNQNQSGYRSLDNHDLTAIPSDFRFTSNNTIALDDGTHKVNIRPAQVTDKIYYTNASGKQIPDTTPITITGNSNSAKSASDTSITNSQFASQHKLPAGYHLVNPDESIGYDGSSHNIAIAPDQATDTINYQVNGVTKSSHQFTGNDVNAQGASDTSFTIGNKPSDLPANYHVINPNQSFNYDGGTHDVAIGFTPSYFNVIEYIDNNGQGSDVGDTSAYGQEGTDVPNKVIEDDVPKDYQLSPNQTLPVQFTKDNVIKVAVQNNDNKNSDMVVGTAYLTLLYKKGNRTDGQVLRLHINGNIGDSDIVINPQDYDKPGYQVSTTKDWHIPFDYSDVKHATNDFSRYNVENTFTYQANPTDITIQYVDTQTKSNIGRSDNLGDIAYDGDTIDLQDSNASNGFISVDGNNYQLNLPDGYHLAHSNNYIKVTANGTYVKKVPTLGGFRMLRMPLMKLTLGITPHFNKHNTKPASTSSVVPVKPSSASSVTPQSASSASTEPSSASVVPSSAGQSVASNSVASSNTIAPSSMASVAPVTPSVTSSPVTSTKASSAQPSSIASASVSVKPSSTSINPVSAIDRPVTHHVSHKHVIKKHTMKPTVHHTSHNKLVKHDSERLNHQVTKATEQLNTVEHHMKARKSIIRKATHAKRTIKYAKKRLHYLRHNKRHVAHALRRITRNKVAIKRAKEQMASIKRSRTFYIKVDRIVLVHTEPSAIGHLRAYYGVIKPWQLRTYLVTGMSKGCYVIKYRGHRGYITANHDYVRNAYYQHYDLRNGRKSHVIRVVHNCCEYRNEHFGQTYVRGLHRGMTLKIRQIATIAKHHMTRFQITNGHWVTANKNFVRLIK